MRCARRAIRLAPSRGDEGLSVTFRILTIFAAALALSACHKPDAAGGEGPKAPAVSEAGSPEAQAFLAKTAKEPGVVVLPSGLEYKVVRSGPATGLKPHLNDEVKVMYEARLA